MIERSAAALLPLALLASGTAAARQTVPVTRQLYEGPAPGSELWRFPERVVTTADGSIFSNVSSPELLAYLPPAGRATREAVLILPGGGLRVLGIDRQMIALVKRLNDRGTAAFILKYRVLQTAPDFSPPAATPARWPDYPPVAIRNANANPSPANAALAEVLRLAVEDTRRAFAIIRANRGRWHVDPARIGVMGTSAGGGVAIGTLLARDPAARPSYVVSIFGPALQDVTVAADAPPLFIVTETGHGPVTDGLQALSIMWRSAKRPVELHMFDVPPGGLRNALWVDRFFDWRTEHKVD